MKRTIEIEDSLIERTDTAIEEVRQALLDYLNDNTDTNSLPDIGNDLDYSGAIHEIVDGSVPIYTYEIDCTWFLYGYELEQAYEDAGIGNNPMENDNTVAIYCYIDQKVHEWYDAEAQEVFEAWRELQDLKDKVKEAGWSVIHGKDSTYQILNDSEETMYHGDMPGEDLDGIERAAFEKAVEMIGEVE
jgi:hypothetical protein